MIVAVRVFKWTRQRRAVVELLVRGTPHVGIAQKLGIHRNTVANLLKREEFASHVAKRIIDANIATSVRRARQATALTDRIAAIADAALTEVELQAQPSKAAARDVLRALREFRRMKRDEADALAVAASAAR